MSDQWQKMVQWSLMPDSNYFHFRDLWFIVGINIISDALDLVTLVASSTSCSSPKRELILFQAGGCLKRSMFVFLSITLSIMFIKSSNHSWDDGEFLYTCPTSNSFVLQSVISIQMHSTASISRSILRLTLFSRQGLYAKGSHYRDAEQINGD